MGLTLQEKLKNLDKLSANFNKKRGKEISGRIGVTQGLKERLVVDFIKTPSLRLNYAMGGGIPRKRVTLIGGAPDSGKTFLLLETIKKEMERDPNFVVGWLESEHSITVDILESVGIDLDRFWFLPVEREGAAEEALNKVEAVLLNGAVDMFVINSLKCLVPTDEQEAGMEKMQIGLQARMNGKMMRKLVGLVEEKDVAFVMIQHLTTDIGNVA